MDLSALLLGFLMPWKFEIVLHSRAVLVSLFDLASPLLFAGLLLGKAGSWRHTRSALILPLLFTGLLATHLAEDSALHSGATIYALWAGMALACLSRGAIVSGLRAGLLLSAGLALPLWFFAPRFVTDHHYFSAFAGSKNGLAFLAGLAAFSSANAGRSAPGVMPWTMMILILLTGSRAGMLAMTGAVLVSLLRSTTPRRDALLMACAVTGATAWLLARTDLPADRWEFASTIVAYAGTIPWNGIGPGSGYGLDLFFKSWLETGLCGFIVLMALIARSLFLNGGTPGLAFLLVFGLAHDPLRWPLFWMVLFAEEKSAIGGGATS